MLVMNQVLNCSARSSKDDTEFWGSYSVDDDVGELVKTNAQEENASKPLELKGTSKEDSEKIPQPTLKDDLPKDWQFKKAHP